MKAAIYKKYGPPEVLKIEDIEQPAIQDDEVLIKVHSASVNPYDCHFRNGILPIRVMTGGLTKPKSNRLGADVAGKIEQVGKNVRRFKTGDHVFGICLGSYGEYVSVDESKISIKPNNLTFEEAAAVPMVALTALQALRDQARIKKGDKVLIYGASGGIGHFAVQLARYYETEVTAVCSSSNLAWVKDLGADFTIDYTKEDFTKGDKKYDIIFDTVGKLTFTGCLRSLTKTGYCILFSLSGLIPTLLFGSLFGRKRVKIFIAKTSYEDFDFIRELIERGEIKPVIDRRYPLDQIVEAFRYAEKGHTKGKVVIEIQKG